MGFYLQTIGTLYNSSASSDDSLYNIKDMIQLHCFADASTKVYAAVIYFLYNSNTCPTVHLSNLDCLQSKLFQYQDLSSLQSWLEQNF